jgi:hypothetical protein
MRLRKFEKQNLNCGGSRKFASPPVIMNRYVYGIIGINNTKKANATYQQLLHP